MFEQKGKEGVELLGAVVDGAQERATLTHARPHCPLVYYFC